MRTKKRRGADRAFLLRPSAPLPRFGQIKGSVGRMVLVSILGIVASFAVVAVLAAQFSPWPSVLILRPMFTLGDRLAMAKLEKHLPSGVTERRDLAYGAGPDAVFDLYFPDNADGPLPVIVWTHGGGWVAGSKEGVGNYTQILASHGYAAVSLNYTRAPEARYPTPVRQVAAALAHLVANAQSYNIDPNRIVLAGDSAGAQITAQLANLVTAPDYAQEMGISAPVNADQIAGVLLFCGAYNLEMAGRSGAFAWFADSILWAYSGTKEFKTDPAIRTASIIDHVTPRFPRTFITGGNGDPLTPQSMAFAQKLRSDGVEVDSLFYARDHAPALPHEYQFNLDIADGAAALERVLAFLNSTLAPASDASTGKTASHKPG